MLTATERFIASRYLRARRAEGLISVIAAFSLIGIALGVATLIVVLAVMRGVRGEMIESIIGLEGHVTVYAQSGRGIPEYEPTLQAIIRERGVKTAIPVAQGQVMVSANGQAVGALASGVRAQDLNAKPLIAAKMKEGNLETFKAGQGVLIGSRLAEKMGLTVGDNLTLISPEGRATPAGMIPRIKAYPIAGIFNIGMFAYDNGLVMMPFEEAQVYFRLSDAAPRMPDDINDLTTAVRPPSSGMASVLEIQLTDADDAPAVATRLSDALGQGYRVYDWKTTNGHLFRAVMVQRNVFFMILTLIILVASFNVVSSLIMLVREKSRSIAILRTMGLSRAAVMRIFITVGASVGVAGTALGVALGLLIALNTGSIQSFIERLTGQPLFADELYFLSSLPAKVDTSEVFAVALMSLALAFLATLHPARKAARINPAEALRYE